LRSLLSIALAVCLISHAVLADDAPATAPAAAAQPVPALALQPGASPAPADSTETALSRETTTSRWYGWQTLATDGAALAIGGAGLVLLDNDATYKPIVRLGFVENGQQGIGGALFDIFAGIGVPIVGGVAYLVGTPIIHKIHHRGAGGFATMFESLGLRVGAASLGALVGSRLAIPSARTCNSAPVDGDSPCIQRVEGGFIGAMVGAVGASALDASLLAHDTVQAEPSEDVSVAPLLLPRGTPVAPQGATGLALSARF